MVRFFCHLLWKIHGRTLAVVADLLDVLGAVWRPCMIFEDVSIHRGPERSVEHLALSVRVSVWRAFVPFVADARSHCTPTLPHRTVPGALPFSVLAVVVEDPLATLAVPPTISVTTRAMGVMEKLVEKYFRSSIWPTKKSTTRGIGRFSVHCWRAKTLRQLTHRFQFGNTRRVDWKVCSVQVWCVFLGAGRSE